MVSRVIRDGACRFFAMSVVRGVLAAMDYRVDRGDWLRLLYLAGLLWITPGISGITLRTLLRKRASTTAIQPHQAMRLLSEA
ncbi:hypothetical protein [Citrobacter sp. JGM124]|uniref:hypothetical protein n=1 Tax=Citrobacter sp. JGM124 TaxID=2799789 RepID=UPI001BA503D3|nr:hypothetical protein [Citrobacter sp. JGM124]MBS0849319.1 hypothetical protein [Citrobacter sp. JGM124]